MYSATLGILWSVCTSTFIPFFKVRAETAYSACPRTPPAESNVAHKNPAHIPPNPDRFMNPPCQEQMYGRALARPNERREPAPFQLLRCFLALLFHYFVAFLPPSSINANTLTGPPDPPSNLIGATTKNAPTSGTPLKSVRFSNWYNPAPNAK